MIPIPTNIPWKIIGSAVGLLLVVAAFAWLIHSRDGWRDTAHTNEQLYHSEQAAHKGTIANYRAASVQAQALDRANVTRVETEAASANQRNASEYQARIADARARYDRLLPHAGTIAYPSGSPAAPVSVVSANPGGTPGPAAQGQLSADDALTATEEAIQLDQLIKAVKDVQAINVNGTNEPVATKP